MNVISHFPIFVSVFFKLKSFFKRSKWISTWMSRKDLEINLSPKKSRSSSTSSLNVLIESSRNVPPHDTVWYSEGSSNGIDVSDGGAGETSWEKPPTSIPIRDREKETQRSLENELVSVILVHCADLKERYEYDTATEALADWFSIVSKNHDHRLSRKEFQQYFSRHHLLHMSENITDDHVNALFDAVEGHTRVDPGYLLWGEIKKYLYEHELWALFDQSYLVTQMHTQFLRRDNV